VNLHARATYSFQQLKEINKIINKLQYLERISHNWFPCRSSNLVELTFADVGFCEGGNRRTQEKTLRARREPTTNSTHIWLRAGIEPGLHW